MGRTFTSKLNPFKDFLRQDRHIHPYAILMVDILIVFVSISLSYVIVGGFGFDRLDFVQYLWFSGCFCAVALPVIFLARLHTGLLRYSNTTDLFNIFAATLTFSLFFLLIYFLIGNRWIKVDAVFLMLTLLINFFITSTLLISFRLLDRKSTRLNSSH